MTCLRHPALAPRLPRRLRRPRHRRLPRATAAARAAHAVTQASPPTAEGTPLRAQRLRPHRARRHGDGPLQAHRVGPGALSRASPTIVAEELDADWSQMRAVHAPADASSTRTSPSACRAPAARPPSPTPTSRCARPAPRRAPCWSPPRPRNGACRQARSPCEQGRIRHAASSRESGFGALAEQGRARCQLPADVDAQGPEGLRADRHRRAAARHAAKIERQGDLHASTIARRDMLTALVAHPAHFGAKVDALRRHRGARRCRASSTSSRCRRASPSMPRTPGRR